MKPAVGRLGGWAVGILVVLSAQPLNRLTAQVSIRLGLGARYSTALVRDSLAVPIDLRPAIAPALQLSMRDDFKGPWTGDATLDLSSSKLKRHESGGAIDAGSVTAVALTLGLRRDLGKGLSGRLGIGGLFYSGSDLGLFQRGGGGFMPVVSLATTLAPLFGQRHGIEFTLQYDVHRFITPALRSVGFNRPRPVHRLAFAVSAKLIGAGR